MDLSSLMIILGSHGFIFLHIRIKHCIHSLDIAFLINVRSDHGGEFENHGFESFCNKHGYGYIFSALRTPQQNEVVERKNCTLKEMSRTMLCENNLPKYFWEKQ